MTSINRVHKENDTSKGMAISILTEATMNKFVIDTFLTIM